MKKNIVLLSLLLSFNIVFAQEQIKVMSFNLHAGHDAPMEEIAKFIKEEQPDIVAIQEIEFYTDRSKHSSARLNDNNEDMVTKIAYLSNLQGMFFPAINVYGGKYGNAVLTRFPIEKAENVLLPFEEKTEQRVAAVCDLKLQSGKIITFIATHLDMASQENGLNQIKKLNELGKAASHPVILAGDLNKRVGTPHIDEIQTTWELSVSNQFDHIAQMLPANFRVISTKVYTGNTLSDHLPITVTYQVK